MSKIIASVGICNTASLNIFNVSCDYIVAGINAKTIEDCETYEIQGAFFDEDNEITDNPDHGEYKPYIDVNGILYTVDEMMRIDL